MKNLKKMLLCAVLGGLLAATAAVAQTPKTVTDFYLLMPADRYSTDIEGNPVKGRAALEKFRRSMIKIEDVKNGYLRLEGPWEGWAEIAIFKHANGGYLVAETSVGCGPACDGSLRLSEYKAGQWTEVTETYAPAVTPATAFEAYRARGGRDEEIRSGEDLPFYYRLPRAGRTLSVACNLCSDEGEGEDFVLLEYDWNGRAFVKK